MYLKKLDVQGVRNICLGLLLPEPGVNLIYGDNGSGKTSLLEAIYLLGRGRSFRTTKLKSIINSASEDCTVYAHVGNNWDIDDADITMGVSRALSGAFRFKVAGRQVYTASVLAETLPIMLMNSDSLALIEGGPSGRRRFLDWGVFHVEQRFRELWRKYQRCHKQRNNLLRHDKIATSQLAVWDKAFVTLSEQVADYRRAYFEKVLPEFQAILSQLNGDLHIEFSLYRGWAEESSLALELWKNRARDIKSQSSHCGAHRADIRLKCDGRPAKEVLSRGQEKIVVLAMQIAQGRVLSRLANKQCLYLLDDLAAELDQVHLSKGVTLLTELGAQVFLTGTDKAALQAVLPQPSKVRVGMFHVKQGVIDQEDTTSL